MPTEEYNAMSRGNQTESMSVLGTMLLLARLFFAVYQFVNSAKPPPSSYSGLCLPTAFLDVVPDANAFAYGIAFLISFFSTLIYRFLVPRKEFPMSYRALG